MFIDLIIRETARHKTTARTICHRCGARSRRVSRNNRRTFAVPTPRFV